ncbi:MAG TPA: nicotinamide riboside transporter PnuC [Thermoanaerobaculia bacterium]|nr:nicotinamide riboside transporter PnuC [Thermoanaerobaculia bacterium]
MLAIEAIATVAGLLCVWLLVRQNIWTWAAGLVQVTLYVYVFYHAKLYSDLILHLIYIVLQFVGWYQWRHGGRARSELAVSRLSRRGNAAALALTLGGAAAWGTFMATKTDAALPWGDAFTMVASLVAQGLQTRKKLETWLYWIAVDVVAIAVFFIKQLYLTTGLYFVFLILSAIGFVEWKREFGAADARADTLPDLSSP